MQNRTPLEDLAEHQLRLNEMRAYLPGLVVQARYAGESWAAIGRALGVTRSEAYRKYAKICTPLTKPAPPAPPA